MANSKLTKFLLLLIAALCPVAAGAAAPEWLAPLVSVELPAYDEKTDAVLLLDEQEITLLPDGGRRLVQRRAYKILRRNGEQYGIVRATYFPGDKIIRMRGWGLPKAGKPFEVGLKDSVETALVPGTSDALISDARMKVLQIPASSPGNVVGYEVEQLSYPKLAGEQWIPQDSIPVVRSRFRLRLPAGWSYKAMWVNGAESSPAVTPDGAWQWEATDLKPIEPEDNMPTFQAVARVMHVAIQAPDAKLSSFRDWNEMGRWFASLTAERSSLTPEISQAVNDRIAGKPTQFDRIKALSQSVQKDIRYVHVALGTIGYQPRSPQDVMKTRYGDCKDKANFLRVLLDQIGTESHLVLVNTTRGVLRADTPPGPIFDHAVIAIRLPPDTPPAARNGMSMIEDGKGGSLLLFDPTDDLTPFGRVGEHLRAGELLLVTAESAKLVHAPTGTPADNGVDRAVTTKLAADGSLSGDVREVWKGVWASEERQRISEANLGTERRKPVEARLALSVSNYQLPPAGTTYSDPEAIENPIEWRYSFTTRNYANVAGDLLMVRPRVLGIKAATFLDTGEKRLNPVALAATHQDNDSMQIELPQGYEVESLPPAVNVDIGFAAYRSRTRVEGNKLVYERTFEQKQLDLPLEGVESLRKLYAAISRDERAVAVLKKRGSP